MNLGALAALAVTLFSAQAGTAVAEPDLAGGLTQCAAIGDVPARVACYDTLAARAHEDGTTSFGNEAAERRAAEATEVRSLSAKVTDYAYTPFGKFIVFLDNGQVWRQQDGDADKAHFVTGENTILITRGAFGSYAASIGDSHHQFKVVRVK